MTHTLCVEYSGCFTLLARKCVIALEALITAPVALFGAGGEELTGGADTRSAGFAGGVESSTGGALNAALPIRDSRGSAQATTLRITALLTIRPTRRAHPLVKETPFLTQLTYPIHGKHCRSLTLLTLHSICALQTFVIAR